MYLKIDEINSFELLSASIEASLFRLFVLLGLVHDLCHTIADSQVFTGYSIAQVNETRAAFTFLKIFDKETSSFREVF